MIQFQSHRINFCDKKNNKYFQRYYIRKQEAKSNNSGIVISIRKFWQFVICKYWFWLLFVVISFVFRNLKTVLRKYFVSLFCIFEIFVIFHSLMVGIHPKYCLLLVRTCSCCCCCCRYLALFFMHVCGTPWIGMRLQSSAMILYSPDSASYNLQVMNNYLLSIEL